MVSSDIVYFTTFTSASSLLCHSISLLSNSFRMVNHRLKCRSLNLSQMDQNCHDQNQAYRWMIEMFDYSYYFRQNYLPIDQNFENRRFVDDFQMQNDFPIIGNFQQ